MKAHVLLFGAGKSATVLIDYLIAQAKKENWLVQVVDANLALAENKTKKRANSQAFGFDIENETEARQSLIANAAIVISLLPPHLHLLVAKDCIQYQRNLLTASYIDDNTRALATSIKENNLLFLYEMGLDPGIDHMSAMQIIDKVKAKGGEIKSFKSHCGGLVAPESDTNPWHYKISWNPKNVVMAGKAGAIFKENDEEVKVEYQELFKGKELVQLENDLTFGYYPNRDSISYIDTYGLQEAETFIRTTLRHPDFLFGWNNLLELDFTNEEKKYDSTNKSLQALLKEHLDSVKFGEWATNKMSATMAESKEVLLKLQELMELEEGIDEEEKQFMSVDETGHLSLDTLAEAKSTGAEVVQQKIHEANLTLKLIVFLGLEDETTIVNKGMMSAADILLFALEQKLMLQPNDSDMIVMLHEFGYKLDEKMYNLRSELVVKGKNAVHTAMAKTVGLPLGIAAKLILNGTIKETGLQIPISKTFYEPVLAELAKEGIVFKETED